MRLRKKLLPVITYVPIDVRRLFRDKVAIFFVFVFPLIFLVIFGFIFRGGGDVSFKVAVLNQSHTAFARTFVDEANKNKVLEIDKNITTLDQAKEKMNRSELVATIILPPDFGEVKNGQYPSGEAKVLYDQNNEQGGRTLASILEGVFKEVNKDIAPSPEPFTVKAESTATQGLSRFDYTFSGLLGFTLLSLGIFGPTTVFPRLKQRGVLRRYRLTNLKVWQYFTGNVISNSAAGLLAVAAMFAAAVVIFDLHMRGDYFSLVAVIILGVTLLFGIGLAIGGWAKNENQAAPLAQLVALPMMFLSGVFFPTFLMPDWLQDITKYIPLTPIVDSIRLVVTEGRTLLEIGPQLGVMAAWLVVIYFIAFRVFRWE